MTRSEKRGKVEDGVGCIISFSVLLVMHGALLTYQVEVQQQQMQ